MKIGNGSNHSLVMTMAQNEPLSKTTQATDLGAAETNESGPKGHQVRENLMEGSFVSNKSETSRYMQATMIGFQVESQFENKMNGILSTYRGQAELANDNYAEKALAGQRSAREVEDMVEGEVSENENERMERERSERIEQEQIEEQEELEAKLRENASVEDEEAEEESEDLTVDDSGGGNSEPGQPEEPVSLDIVV